MYGLYIKRILDAAAAAVLLVLALPMAIIAAVAVYASMGKPIFFRQRRPGMNERPFELLKFRTMTDCRDSQGRLLPEKDRLTAVGHLLRKFSIDEIPQLWNVLKGDMSIVGPRPLLMEYLPYYRPRERTRHSVRPGLTGLSQVSGRNMIDWDARLEYDARYVENLGFMLDAKILLKTARQVVFGAGVNVVPGSVVPPLHVFRAGGPRLVDADPVSTLKIYSNKGSAMKIPLVKRAFLCLFSRINPGDIVVRHYLTGDRFHLHSFYHRSYWFHGKRREAETMRMFARCISPGDCVFDVGGHIGYVAQYFSSLVKPSGSVYVFEPAPNNLFYLKKNVENIPNVTLVPKAVGDAERTEKMFIESLTGQNCSFNKDYVEKRNAERAGMAGPKPYESEVEIVTLDRFALEGNIIPNFIKIDVEGFEWQVLQGAQRLLDRAKPMLMVEMRANQEQVVALLAEKGYRLFNTQMKAIDAAEECGDNVFCLHENAHLRELDAMAKLAA